MKGLCSGNGVTDDCCGGGYYTLTMGCWVLFKNTGRCSVLLNCGSRVFCVFAIVIGDGTVGLIGLAIEGVRILCELLLFLLSF